MDHFRTERRLAAILAADVVGYSLPMAADEKPHPPEGAADRLIRPWIVENHGRVAKLMGDGMRVEFASVVNAVECAAAIQKGLADDQAELPEDQRIVCRIGINIDDVNSKRQLVGSISCQLAARAGGRMRSASMLAMVS